MLTFRRCISYYYCGYNNIFYRLGIKRAAFIGAFGFNAVRRDNFRGCSNTFNIETAFQNTVKRNSSSFALELPPYRTPQIGKVIVRSIFDRTLYVLGRAASVAAPAGAVIWILSNVRAGDISLLNHCTEFLDPLGKLMGLDGVILFAFILGLPANEIVLPIILMSYMGTGSITGYENLEGLGKLLSENGWNVVTAICFILFSLMHFPCATTCITIYKETKSIKWTGAAFLLPTVIGMLFCVLVNLTGTVLGC